jgi:hypothetical protein
LKALAPFGFVVSVDSPSGKALKIKDNSEQAFAISCHGTSEAFPHGAAGLAA